MAPPRLAVTLTRTRAPQYYSDLTEDMKLFFMDKVEKELRGTDEYMHMLEALGTTLDNVR